MKKAFLILFVLVTSAFAQQRAIVYELGPQVFSTHVISKGYPWRAWGYVYPRGTFANRPACEVPDVRPLGVWVIQGTTGNPLLYRGTYRVTIGAQTYYFGGEVNPIDEDGFPLSSLFDAKGVGEGGKIELTPRSADCFGGELKIFQGE